MPSISLTAPSASNISSTSVSASYTTSGFVTSLPSATIGLYESGDTRNLLTSVSLLINGTSKATSTSTSGTLTALHGSTGASFTIQAKASYTTYYVKRTQTGTTTTYYWYTYTTSSGGSGSTGRYTSKSDARAAVPDGATNITSHSSGGNPIYSYSWASIDSYSTTSSTYTRYGKPAKWSFVYSNTNYTWIVDKGIQTLITNITSFPSAAKKYKQWEKQSAQLDCNSLFNSNNELSASQINKAIEYLTGTLGTYKAGDDVSKAIFNTLQSKLNYS